MSRGPGWIQERLLEIFSNARGEALSTTELCRKVYGEVAIHKKHRVAVLRAVRKLASGPLNGVWRARQRFERADALWYEYRYLPLVGLGRRPVLRSK